MIKFLRPASDVQRPVRAMLVNRSPTPDLKQSIKLEKKFNYIQIISALALPDPVQHGQVLDRDPIVLHAGLGGLGGDILLQRRVVLKQRVTLPTRYAKHSAIVIQQCVAARSVCFGAGWINSRSLLRCYVTQGDERKKILKIVAFHPNFFVSFFQQAMPRSVRLKIFI